MYRVDFVNKDNYGQVLYSFSLAEGLDNVKLSAEQIAGTDYFAREPRRVEFECFKDAWLEEHILSGSYEHDRYISHYEVRLYEKGMLCFHGVIDTSFTAYDAKTDIISFTCYDKLKLFSKFSDLKMLYALIDGYSCGYSLGYMIQGIENKISLNIPAQWNNSYTPLNIQVNQLEILKIKWKELLSEFKGWDSYSLKYGLCDIGNNLVELQVLIVSEIPDESNRKKVKILGRKWIFYNTICPVEDTIQTVDEESDWFDVQADCDEYIESNTVFYQQAEVSALYANGKAYSTALSDNDMFYDTASEEIPVYFSGNVVPESIFPKGFYQNGNEQTERLKVLKAVLMLHHLTIITDNAGTLYLLNKAEVNNTLINIADQDIIEFKKKRINRSVPDTSVLDVLLGDNAKLKDLISNYYSEYFSGIWEIELSLDNLNKYNLHLFDKLQIQGLQYKITELQRDTINDEYLIKGWQI